MKTNPISITDFIQIGTGKGKRRRGTRDVERNLLFNMPDNTALMITSSKISCKKRKHASSRYPQYCCSLRSLAGLLKKDDQQGRHWSIKHTPQGHAVACFSSDPNHNSVGRSLYKRYVQSMIKGEN